MKIAIIGQSVFGAEVYKELCKKGHKIVGVFTIPDVNGRADPLAQIAESDGTKVFKFNRWRLKGKAIPEVLAEYQSVQPDLNVMPFCSQFIPMEVITAPKHQSIIYHPSLLPRGRGASAINWTLINGDAKAGFSVFWADEGLDTGPILLQRECEVEPNDTVDTLYNRFLFPVGIESMVEAVDMIEKGTAPRLVQPEQGATYDQIVTRKSAAINWNLSAQSLHNFIRGHDKVPGAWGKLDGQETTFYGSSIWNGASPDGQAVEVDGLNGKAVVHSGGLLIPGSDGKCINVSQLKLEESGRMIPAHKYGAADEGADLGSLTDEEQAMGPKMKEVWASILGSEVEDSTDFFKSGAGSMDVTRLVEEVKQKCGIVIQNTDVYMAPVFSEFFNFLVLAGRGETDKPFEYDSITKHVNDMDVVFPHQLFINNQFIDADSGKTFQTIDPSDESLICEIALGGASDVNKAVAAAHEAFENGEWGKMNARDRGSLMYKLADVMDQHKEELATLESMDSGAVYTLALKTHIGMSIDTFRYFAGWCDKIEGTVIPINNARPNKNLAITKREPVGVVGLITPWNYPLMMLAWKMAACLAAGNTVVLKPAQVTPLTSLKFCELVVKAGFPSGVINVVPGPGSVVGEAIANHPDVRKLGFTGSTEVGHTIMQSCAKSNLKKVSLELGGKSPLIIFSDCDLEKAAKLTCGGVFFNKGENCIAAGRIFVQEDIHDKFLESIITEVKKMKVGNPLDRSTDHGPQNHKAHLNKLVEYCDQGVKEGARLVHGGKRSDRPGLFFEPTVFTDVGDSMMLAKDESFGPVMIISKFKTLEEVILRANDTEFGLASGVFTKDISKALTVADRLHAGTVFVNTYNKTDVAAPFGGFKRSGFGKDLGKDALHEYLRTKTITFEY